MNMWNMNLKINSLMFYKRCKYIFQLFMSKNQVNPYILTMFPNISRKENYTGKYMQGYHGELQ